MPRRKNPLSEFARGMDKMSRQMSDRLPPRERVDSKKRKKVIEKYKGRCAICGLKRPRLRIHHKNMNPSDNRPSNLLPLCPNCHDDIHDKKRIKVYRNMIGGIDKTKVVRKSKKTKKIPIKGMFGEIIGYKTVRTKKKTVRRKTIKKKTAKRKKKQTFPGFW